MSSIFLQKAAQFFAKPIYQLITISPLLILKNHLPGSRGRMDAKMAITAALTVSRNAGRGRKDEAMKIGEKALRIKP
ncbi:hypothetical protein ACYULU_11530 [Breznakiellaceae bacterium SP9]